MLAVNQDVRGGSLGDQPLLKPFQGGRDAWVPIAETLDDLHDESCGDVVVLLAVVKQRALIGRLAVHSQQAIGNAVRLFPLHTTAHDAACGAPQVLDEHDSQCDRNRPQFADRQGLHALIGAHETAQRFDFETTVTVCDTGPRDAEDAGIADERTVGELRQLPIETRRQIAADFADLLLDQMVVVE